MLLAYGRILRSSSHLLPSRQRIHTMAQAVSVKIPALNKEIKVPTGLFINNEFVASVDSKDLIQ